MDSDSNFLLNRNPLSGELLPDDPLARGTDGLFAEASLQAIKAKAPPAQLFEPLAETLQPLKTQEEEEEEAERSQHSNPFNNPISFSPIDFLTGSPSNKPVTQEETLSNQETEFSPTASQQQSSPSFSSATSTTTSVPLYAIAAEGAVRVNNGGDFDGNPTNPNDDAFIYGGAGFTFNNQTILPVQRDAAGNPIVDDRGRPILVDKAVAVSSSYREANVSSNNVYSGLLPPQIIPKQTISVPTYSTLKTEELNRRIPVGTTEVIFPLGSKPLNNLTDWNRNFPAPGTATNPNVVRITGGGLNIPDKVDLSNYVITVDSGDINFNGSGHDLSNVVLVTNNGNVNFADVQGIRTSVLASGSINANQNVRLSGENLLANGNGNITFSGATQTTNTSDVLRLVSQGTINFNAAANTRGYLLSKGDVNFNGLSFLVGSIASKGNITFNNGVTVIGAIERSNSAPTDILLNPNSVAENTPNNTVVGSFNTVDADIADSHTYSLVAGVGDADNSAFTLVNNQLRLNNYANFETKNSYSIRIRTTDTSGASIEKVISVSITNINEAPTLLSLSNSSVAENSTGGTLIGQLSTTDPDAGDTHTYSLMDNAEGHFVLSGNQLQVAPGALLNFESDRNYSITVRTTDALGLSRTEQLIITLTDVAEAPTNLILNPTTLAENVPNNTVVGTFTTSDPDAGDTHNVTLVAGEGDTDNAAFGIVGNELLLNNSPDFENKSSYSIRVSTTDAAGLSTTQQFIVGVSNVPEAPTDITLSANTV